ncbi:hypothetical protein AO263_31300, partial [Pseudomonas sp. NZIPFR-PS5]
RTLLAADGKSLASHDVQSFAAPAPGAINALKYLKQHGIPCAWIDEYPSPVTDQLAAPLSNLILPTPPPTHRWPAPDACWQALMILGVMQLDGCVLVSGDPRLLMSLELYAAGAHSVIDHLGELESCLADITLRRQKSEKP